MKIQQWANKRKLAKSWSYGYGITGIKPEKDRIKSWEKRCNDSTCSFWLACLFLSNPTRFSPTYQLKSFRPIESVIDKRKSCCHFSWRNGSTAVWMLVHPTYTAVILDLKGFLINQKLFLSTSEYHYYYQGRKWNMPDFWNCHSHSLSNVFSVHLKLLRSPLLTCFFLPSCFSLLSSGSHFAPTALRKQYY